MKRLLFIFTLFITSVSFAQLENANWCFGINAGVNFNASPPTPFTSQSTYSTPNSSFGSLGTPASVSDENGQLLFYTNGMTVWNNASPVNQPMPNGTGLHGAIDISYDNQNTVIVPKPNHPGIYYIFTLSFFYNSPFDPTGIYGGAHYSVVDMSLDGGKGDIVFNLKNISLKDHNGVPIEYNYSTNTGLKMTIGKITTALHHDKDKIWVTIFPRFDIGGLVKRYAYSYLVTENGINGLPDGAHPTLPQPIVPTPPASVLLDNVNYDASTNPINEAFGSIKISPNGQLLCDATNRVNLYNFNNNTGEINFSRNIYTPPANTYIGHGIEFSPGNQYLYFSDYFYNIIGQDKNNSASLITTKYAKIYQNQIGTVKIREVWSSQVSNFATFPADRPFALQLAINNQIYVALPDGMTQSGSILGAIELPNLPVPNCTYNPNSITLISGTSHAASLPQWVHKAKPNIWPKVYTSKSPQYFGKDNSGNIFMSLHEDYDLSIHINHIGALPTTISTTEGNYLFHYNTASGVTNWAIPDFSPNIVLNSGAIQGILGYTNNYGFISAASGNPIAGPSSVPSNEIILAETSSGEFISRDLANTTLYLHPGSSSYVTSGEVILNKTNPAQNKLFVIKQTAYSFTFDIFNVSANTMSYVASYALPPSTLNNVTRLIKIDNQNRVFCIKDHKLQQYDYTNNSFTIISISGFTNDDLWPVWSFNPYSGNQALVTNLTEENIYAINFGSVALPTMTEKKIATSDIRLQNLNYVLNGDDVLFCGLNLSANSSIGTHQIPFVTIHNSTFLIKLSLAGDFNARYSDNSIVNSNTLPPSFDMILSPNPSYNLLKVKINESKIAAFPTYSVFIVNQYGKTVLKKEKFYQGSYINIESLRQGIYYVEVINNKGEKSGRPLIKL